MRKCINIDKINISGDTDVYTNMFYSVYFRNAGVFLVYAQGLFLIDH